LNSSLKDRRSFVPMTPRSRIFAGSMCVSGKTGQAQTSAIASAMSSPIS